MCGRYEGENEETWRELHEIFDNFVPSHADLFGREIRPTVNYPILIKTSAGTYEPVDARWWLIPSWHKGSIKDWKATTFNAKIEEAADKASFRGPWKNRHCLVPVSSFWEWTLDNPEAPKSKQTKTRHSIRRGDNQHLVLAGLWDRANTADGEVASFTILTRAAGADMAALHTREPVALARDQWKPWMDCEPMPELATPGAPGLYRHTVESRVYA